MAAPAGWSQPQPGAGLATPALTFGTQGEAVMLEVNHFVLAVAGGATQEKLCWQAWRVDFPELPVETDKGKGKGKAKGKDQGKGQRDPAPFLRMSAIRGVMAEWPEYTWIYDGRNSLYTRSDQYPLHAALRSVHTPTLEGCRRSVRVEISEAQDAVSRVHQVIDLSKLLRPRAGTGDIDVQPERRFLEISMRFLPAQSGWLVTKGRRLICPKLPWGFGATLKEQELKHGRDLWWGFLLRVSLTAGRDGRLQPTVSCNLVPSVALKGMWAIDLLARLLSEEARCGFDQMQNQLWANKRHWLLDDRRMKNILNSEVGLRKVKVSIDYMDRGHPRNKVVVGVTELSAKDQKFWLEKETRQISVEEYFRTTFGVTLACPDLPCLCLTNDTNYVPIELVWVRGGEHNILAGKLRQDYQDAVTRYSAMPPRNRRDGICKVLQISDISPAEELKKLHLLASTQMMEVKGRVLKAPIIVGGGGDPAQGGQPLQIGSFANSFQSLSPPTFEVKWGLWLFTHDGSHRDVQWFARDFKNKATSHGIRLLDAEFVDWPKKSYDEFSSRREVPSLPLENAVKEELRALPEDLKLLTVMLPDKESKSTWLRGIIKRLTETNDEFMRRGLATQFIVCQGKGGKSGWEVASTKLNNVMVKLTGKLSKKEDGTGFCNNIKLIEANRFLTREPTMIIGADVTHHVHDVSVAGVVATATKNFMNYFAELRGQVSFDVDEVQTRTRRKSEEKIRDLGPMVVNLLRRWRKANSGRLPETIFYYRDGVSDGQFTPVLSYERNALAQAFAAMRPDYDPKLVVIVGQKRHGTRLFKKDKGKGNFKGKEGFECQVDPGTVAAEGIASPSHINFFLVSQKSGMGTAVPCHYHVLHLDERLIRDGLNVDDLERITYDLCHLYSRADKAVGYAAPAYMADHLCERGKLYLESKYGSDTSGGSSGPGDVSLRDIQERVNWLNGIWQNQENNPSQGRMFAC